MDHFSVNVRVFYAVLEIKASNIGNLPSDVMADWIACLNEDMMITRSSLALAQGLSFL